MTEINEEYCDGELGRAVDYTLYHSTFGLMGAPPYPSAQKLRDDARRREEKWEVERLQLELEELRIEEMRKRNGAPMPE